MFRPAAYTRFNLFSLRGFARGFAVAFLAAGALGAAALTSPVNARNQEARSAASNRAPRAIAVAERSPFSAPYAQPRRRAVAITHPARRTASRPAVSGLPSGQPPIPRTRDPAQDLIPAASEGSTGSPRAACLEATERAERVHGLPPGLLTAVALAESGLHAYALSIGGRAHFPETEAAARALVDNASPSSSIMAGCVQVNARVHARNSHWPLNPTTSADWAGGMMARWARETGSWSTALRRWHGGSPDSTQRLVCRVKAKLDVTSPGSEVFQDFACDATLAERTRRNGAIHLATAQRHAR